MRTRSERFGFRFTESNPLTGDAFAYSRFADLPGFAADVVVDGLRLDAGQWDHLVEHGMVIETTGHGVYWVPGAVIEPCRACSGDGRHRVAGMIDPDRSCGRCGGAGERVIIPTGGLDRAGALFGGSGVFA